MAEEIKLTRRRLLGGVAATGVAGLGAGFGSTALFSDQESSAGNAVTTGTLDLKVDGSDQTVTFLDETKVVPGDSGASSVELANAGTIPGSLEITITDIRSTENDYFGAENGQDTSPNDGELDAHLEVRAEISGRTLFPRTEVENIPANIGYTYPDTLEGGASHTLILEWWLPDDTPNIAQSDGVEFDLKFSLTQVDN